MSPNIQIESFWKMPIPNLNALQPQKWNATVQVQNSGQMRNRSLQQSNSTAHYQHNKNKGPTEM